MDKELRYPDRDAVSSVLVKIGVDPASRDLDCQDLEYTTCNLDELSKYSELYGQKSTSDKEKRILGCYLLQCLNDYISVNNSENELQSSIFHSLFEDKYIHQSEIEYWSEHDWPIAESLQSHREKQQ
jgi:hypothetical protein